MYDRLTQRAIVRSLLTKVHVVCHIFEDVRDVVLEDELFMTPVKEGTISQDPSHEDYSHIRGGKSLGSTNGGECVNSVPEQLSLDKLPKTPSKKPSSGMHINLEKDSNSKKLENKFKFDFTDESHLKPSQPEPPQRLIVRNIEHLLSKIDTSRSDQQVKPFEIDEKDRAFSVGGEARFLMFQESLASSSNPRESMRLLGVEAKKALPAEKSDKYCNPCTLI